MAFHSVTPSLLIHILRIHSGVKTWYYSPRIKYLVAKSMAYRLNDHPHTIYHVSQRHDSMNGELLFDEVHDLIVIMLSQMILRGMRDDYMNYLTMPVSSVSSEGNTTLMMPP